MLCKKRSCKMPAKCYADCCENILCGMFEHIPAFMRAYSYA